ncbi:hypothetical protein IMCC20628_00664 [Hoeflea sp. IMCC20628]|uniref:hypothetical protein n=1 Tax=Hoeflea sp. IMCC20628 TaxID=1620421 RepID=UPI00063AC53D|nr:hypothetical protein [Hoeflea sp. IMCC20628]AKH99388.1 hypothetical protein IMCC20628_00664 [Hoeflea sp. IMCC20628]
MILGQSMFEVVLDRLGKDRADALQSSSSAWNRIRGLNASFVGAGCEPARWRDSEQPNIAASAYNDDVLAPPPKPAFDASQFKRLSPEDVAKDIQLLPSDNPTELHLKRRNFARLNHPDRVPEEWRDAATTRMKIANRLIDDALALVALTQA